jgi:hypothetical protein
MLNKTIKDRPINKLFISVILTLLSLSSCVILRKRNVDYVEEASNLYIEMIEINGGVFEMGCDNSMRS